MVFLGACSSIIWRVAGPFFANFLFLFSKNEFGVSVNEISTHLSKTVPNQPGEEIPSILNDTKQAPAVWMSWPEW